VTTLDRADRHRRAALIEDVAMAAWGGKETGNRIRALRKR